MLGGWNRWCTDYTTQIYVMLSSMWAEEFYFTSIFMHCKYIQVANPLLVKGKDMLQEIIPIFYYFQVFFSWWWFWFFFACGFLMVFFWLVGWLVGFVSWIFLFVCFPFVLFLSLPFCFVYEQLHPESWLILHIQVQCSEFQYLSFRVVKT